MLSSLTVANSSLAVSDEEITEKYGWLSQLEAGDLILADKGFLIHNIVSDGVTVNIPPFLNHSRFTKSPEDKKHSKM